MSQDDTLKVLASDYASLCNSHREQYCTSACRVQAKDVDQNDHDLLQTDPQRDTCTERHSPVTAGEALVPAAGEAEDAPGDGDWLEPAAGEAEVVPEAGDGLAPAAGEAEVVPDAGELKVAPVAGDAEVVPSAGEVDVAAADAIGLLLAPDAAGDAPVAAGDAPEDAAGLCTPKH